MTQSLQIDMVKDFRRRALFSVDPLLHSLGIA